MPNIENIKNNLKKENKEYLNEIAKDYFNFIQNFNSIKNSSSKNFYIIISLELLVFIFLISYIIYNLNSKNYVMVMG